MAVLFISDLHLEPARPDRIDDFRHFCATRAREADSLYILGDLFEAWIGDDEDDDALGGVLDSIAQLCHTGVRCYFMHGNRDFLAGRGFAERTGATILGDYECITLFGERVLLMHGDLLCTDDVRYLELRRQLRDAGWQQDFLSKSLDERRQIAAGLRELSKNEMAAKSEAIMDVNDEAVRATMRQHDVRMLLHGHTHRPAIHRFDLDGQPAIRVVLSDWYGPGGYARWTGEGPVLESLGSTAG